MYLKKVIVALWALMVAAVAAIILLIPFVPSIGLAIRDFTQFMEDNSLFASIAALILGLSLWLFFAQFQVDRPQTPSSVVLNTEGGEVRIALVAVETLVRQAAGQLKGVREVRTGFFRRNEGLGVHLRATVSAEGGIPDLVAQLQQRVAEHVFNTAGIRIEEVKVLVDNVAAGPHNRVELR